MNDREVIRDCQRDFTKGKLFLTDLVAFYDAVNLSADRARATDVISLEFCKAFDNSVQQHSWCSIGEIRI